MSRRFRSKYDHTIDEKGRLSFPSRFREVLRQYESEVLIVIPWWDNHLRAYPLSEWENIEDKLKAEDREQPEDLDKIIRYFESESIECVLDKQGRILLPPGLRAELGLKKDIVLIGMIDRVEIWDKDAWNAERQVGREQFGEHKESIRKMGII
ncbi:MAG: division/cell wall cluster transcriptional repressor MraZ [Desulfocapsaceae bacterium]|nr:division/cell wall cluster transcriptional repressor MraZ [Desulfocapsaceae bacterium]